MRYSILYLLTIVFVLLSCDKAPQISVSPGVTIDCRAHEMSFTTDISYIGIEIVERETDSETLVENFDNGVFTFTGDWYFVSGRRGTTEVRVCIDENTGTTRRLMINVIGPSARQDYVSVIQEGPNVE